MQEKLARGAATDWGSYQLYVGYNLAYQWVLDNINEMVKEAYKETSGEDDD